MAGDQRSCDRERAVRSREGARRFADGSLERTAGSGALIVGEGPPGLASRGCWLRRSRSPNRPREQCRAPQGAAGRGAGWPALDERPMAAPRGPRWCDSVTKTFGASDLPADRRHASAGRSGRRPGPRVPPVRRSGLGGAGPDHGGCPRPPRGETRRPPARTVEALTGPTGTGATSLSAASRISLLVHRSAGLPPRPASLCKTATEALVDLARQWGRCLGSGRQMLPSGMASARIQPCDSNRTTRATAKANIASRRGQ